MFVASMHTYTLRYIYVNFDDSYTYNYNCVYDFKYEAHKWNS
jgi:hypothetical protein